MNKNGCKIERLGNLCEIVSGSTPKTNIENYWNGTYCWITPAEINDESIVIDNTVRKITALAVKDTSLRLLPKGTVLLSSRAPIGKVAIAGIDMYCNQGFKNFVCSESIHNKYLFWYLKKNNAYLNSLGRGATFKEISKSIVENLEIPLPPLATQKHIADILDAADALRRKTQQIVESYDELAQSIFLEMFGDPVSNPKGWEMNRFCDLFESRLGKMLDVKKQIISDESIPYLGNSNVLWGKFNLDNLQQMTFSEKEKEIYSLKKGDLLICEGGEAGRCAIWNDDNSKILFQKAIHRARKISKKINVCYVQMTLLFLKQRGGLKNYLTSATIQHLTGEKLKQVPIPTPPLDLQKLFAEKIALIEQQKELAKQSLTESENLFNTLLQKAFKGELVPEPQPTEQAV